MRCCHGRVVQQALGIIARRDLGVPQIHGLCLGADEDDDDDDDGGGYFLFHHLTLRQRIPDDVTVQSSVFGLLAVSVSAAS